MTSFGLADVLRRTRQARAALRLDRRDDGELTFVDDAPVAGGRILLDTCVYIDQLKGRAPLALEALIVARTAIHSALAMAEMAFSFGRLNPQDPRTEAALDAIKQLLSSVPSHRVVAADAQAWSEGAVRAGVMSLVLGLAEDGRRKAVHDAVLAAQAVREGAIVVTRNVADFDRLQQLDPRLRVLFYRT